MFISTDSLPTDVLYTLSSRPWRCFHHVPWLSHVKCSNKRELRTADWKWRTSQFDADLLLYCSDVTTAKISFYKRKHKASAAHQCKHHTVFSPLFRPPSHVSLTADDFATFFDYLRNLPIISPSHISTLHSLFSLLLPWHIFYSFYRRASADLSCLAILPRVHLPLTMNQIVSQDLYTLLSL